MNKKLLAVLTSILVIIPTTSQAANKAIKLRNTTVAPSIAIIDTALDTSLPLFAGKIAYEVCILDWNSCPNGTNFMEGTGAAVLPFNIISKNGFDHGTQMASAAIQTNPDMNIVFVRIIGNTASGLRQNTSEKALVSALNWVYNNRDKFNIQAVSMSQSNHNLLAGTDYCPKTVDTINSVNNLLSVDIPSFFPTGNARDYARIDWPACISSSVAVGATDQYNAVAIYGNYDPLLTDFFALGTMKVYLPGNTTANAAGTSVATAVAASSYIKIKAAKPGLNYQQLRDLISKTAKPTSNSKVKSGLLINIGAAING